MAQAQVKTAEPPSTVQVTTLPNGFRIATDYMQSVETVAIGIWAAVGTRHEPAAHNGVAHLLEHMAFKGTSRRTARDIVVEIEAVGGYLNAYTGREQTAYYARVLSEDVPLAVDIIADIIQHSAYEAAELTRERAVVLQEIGQAEDTPDDIIFDHFQEIAYPDQAMGRPVLGRADIVRDLPRDVVANYLRGCYRADQMVLCAAGKINHDELVDLASKAFDQLPVGAPPATEAAAYRGGDLRLERDLEQVHVVLGFDALSHTDPDYYAASVMSQLFGGGMSSRLFQEVREKRGLVYSINSFTTTFNDTGVFGIYAGTGEDEVAEMMPVICDELARLPHDLDDQEVYRAAVQLKAGTLMSREKTSARCEQLANQVLIFNRPISISEVVAKIDAVTPDDIRRVTRRFLKSAPTLVSLGPVGRVMAYDKLRAHFA